METLMVDIWSDLVCPFCYIGKRRFETALAGFERRDAVEVRWRSFELDPDGPTEPTETLPERSRRDLGGTLEQTRQRLARVSEMASEVGLTYDLERAMAVNSFDAHRLMQLADRAGVGDAVRERLMHAYVAEGAILTDADTLARIGAESGLDKDGVLTMLAGTDLAEAVRTDEQLGRTLGVSGVPTFVAGRRLMVSGAQPVEIFTRLLEEGWKNTT